MSTVQRDHGPADPDGTVDVDPSSAPTPDPIMHKDQAPQPKKGAVPQRQGNGYYADHRTGKRLRSVTTILEGGVPKPQIVFWAAGVCVDSAIANLPALVAASRFADQLADLAAWLKRAHTQAKEERGDVGTFVHKMIEATLLGLDLPTEVVIPAKKADEEPKILRADDPELAPFIQHFRAFVEEYEVTFEASEMVVVNPDDGWAGTLDFLLRSPRIAAALRAAGFDVPDDALLMGDTKTGGTLDRITSAGHFHGVYPEAGLQMSAYKRARRCWLKSGDQVDMPATADVGIVLHLRPEGYRIFPTRVDEEVYTYFRHAQMVDQFTSKIASAKAKNPVVRLPLNGPHHAGIVKP